MCHNGNPGNHNKFSDSTRFCDYWSALPEQYAAPSALNINKRDHRDMGTRINKYDYSRYSDLYIFTCSRAVWEYRSGYNYHDYDPDHTHF